MRRKPKNPAFSELKQMLPAFLVTNGLLLIGIAFFGVFDGASYRVFTGLIVGNLLCVGNFCLIGASALSTVNRATAKKGQIFANLSYGGRYIGIFLILAAGLYFNVIDIIPAFVPLFIPKIHYVAFYLFWGKEPENTDIQHIK